MNLKCESCGKKVEDPNAIIPMCYGCRLAAALPHGHEQREDYRKCEVDGTFKAQQKPATGKDILDTPGPSRCVDIAAVMPEQNIEHMRLAERLQGVAFAGADWAEFNETWEEK